MEIVGQFTEVLPVDGESPTAPFTGFVINFNVTTLIHWDNDRGFCVVIVVSEDCEGGALCLEEPARRGAASVRRTRKPSRNPEAVISNRND